MASNNRAARSHTMTREEYMAEVERLGRPVTWPPQHRRHVGLLARSDREEEGTTSFRPADATLEGLN